MLLVRQFSSIIFWFISFEIFQADEKGALIYSKNIVLYLRQISCSAGSFCKALTVQIKFTAKAVLQNLI